MQLQDFILARPRYAPLIEDRVVREMSVCHGLDGENQDR
jgi:hypothetical protein